MAEGQLKELQLLLKNITVRKDRPRIPTFAGRPIKPKDTKFSDWLYIVRKANVNIKDYNIQPSELLNIVFHSLTDEARSRYIRLDCDTFNLDQLLDSFELTYGDRASTIDKIQSFHEIKQSKDESIISYADRLETLAFSITHGNNPSEFYKNDEVLKMTFIKGLFDKRLPDLLLYMADDKDKSYEDVRVKAIVLSQDCKRSEEKKVFSVQTDMFDKLNERLSSIETQLKDFKNNECTHRQVDNAKPRFGYEKSDSQKNRKCFYCGRIGHIKRFCYKFKNDMSSQFRRPEKDLN